MIDDPLEVRVAFLQPPYCREAFASNGMREHWGGRARLKATIEPGSEEAPKGGFLFRAF